MTDFKSTISIAATFTAEPVQPVLEFWASRLEENWTVEFAPFNQVLQTVLDPSGSFAQNTRGANVVLVRPNDLAQFEGATEVDERERLLEILGVLKAASFRVPLLVALCPPVREGFAELLGAAAAAQPNLHAVDTSLYPVEDWRDEAAEKLGRIPYTTKYFAALGTSIARLYHALDRPPFKLIALDCDNTLWDGICGEDGPTGVVVDSGRQELQKRLLAQRDAGMLLALASKNNPADVEETFDAHPEMLLRREHITAQKLNWRPKSANLREMAAELSLGSDSFLLLDDNSKEIAELQGGAPEITGLTLPTRDDNIARYLDHVWAFDHPVITEADRQRVASYDQQRHFSDAASTTTDLKSFYRSLELKVRIEKVREADMTRAAQLTQRTNQFNFTTRRRTQAE